MGELVDELVDMGYVVRRPDLSDGRAKLIMVTDRGRSAVAAGRQTIEGLEEQVTAILGERGQRELRRLLSTLLGATNSWNGGSLRARTVFACC
jgi:DNA-binding MarR family transcriptional regulator